MRIPPIPPFLTAVVSAVFTAGLASAAPHFHSDFDEASLGAITGLNIDTPSTTGADSGTVTLDTVNQTLNLVGQCCEPLDGSRGCTDRMGHCSDCGGG